MLNPANESKQLTQQEMEVLQKQGKIMIVRILDGREI